MSATRAPIRVLSNAMELVEVLAAQGPLSPADAAEQIGIPRSSAWRLIDGLTAIGLVEPLADRRVRLSARWLQLSDATHAALTEWSGSSDALGRLVQQTGQTAYLSVLTDGEAVCVDWRRGSGLDVLALKPGRRLPPYAGAAGRVMLAYAVDVDEFLAAAPFPRLTEHTLVEADTLRADIERTRTVGYALSQSDVTLGISAIGMPLFRSDGTVAGCVSIGGLSQAFDGTLPALHEALTVAADKLTSIIRADA